MPKSDQPPVDRRWKQVQASLHGWIIATGVGAGSFVSGAYMSGRNIPADETQGQPPAGLYKRGK